MLGGDQEGESDKGGQAVKPIRAAMVTPLTGPLAMYGRVAGEALRLWADEVAEPGSVALRLYDTHPDPVSAVRQAEASRPDVLFGPYGRGPALAVARATSRLVWNGGGATDRLAAPEFENVVNIPAPAASYFQGGLAAIRDVDATVDSLVVVHTGKGFSGEVARGAVSAAEQAGMTWAEVQFQPGHAGESLSRTPSADVLALVGSFRDESEMVRAVKRRRWRAVLSVAAGVDEVLEALGDRREGLLGPAQWTPAAAPRPDLGPDAEWFVSAYHRRFEASPPYPAAQALAAAVIWSECVRLAGTLDDGALLVQARRLDVRTLYGAFRIDPVTGLQVGHRVVTVQWQDGRRRVVWPPHRAEFPLRMA